MSVGLARRLAQLPDDQLGTLSQALQAAGRRAETMEQGQEGRGTIMTTAFEEKVAAAARKMRIGQVGKATRQLAAMIDADADEAAIAAGLQTLIEQGYLVVTQEATAGSLTDIPRLREGGLLVRGAASPDYAEADPATIPRLGERGLFRHPTAR